MPFSALLKLAGHSRASTIKRLQKAGKIKGAPNLVANGYGELHVYHPISRLDLEIRAPKMVSLPSTTFQRQLASSTDAFAFEKVQPNHHQIRSWDAGIIR